MFETWFFAVRGLMPSSSAISAFSIPRAISRSTSSSRGDSSSIRLGSGSSSTPRAPDAPQHDLGGARRKPRHALRRGPHGQRDAVDRRVLGEEATRAGLERGRHVAVVRDDGQREHARRRMALEDLARGVGPFEVGHADIHDDDVRLEFIRQPHAHAAAGRLRDDLDVWLAASSDASPARNRS